MIDLHGFSGLTHFSVRFSSNILIINGDSATGKTLLYNSAHTLFDKYYLTMPMTLDSNKEHLLEDIATHTNRLYVFDRADIWLLSTYRELIEENADKNKFIILGRYTKYFGKAPTEVVQLLTAKVDNTQLTCVYTSNMTDKEALAYLQQDM